MTSAIGTVYEDMKLAVHPDTFRYGGAWWSDGRAYQGHMLKAFVDEYRDHPPFTLLDVGASTGAYALMAAYLPQMRVFAFEPDPRAYDVLEKNIAINGLSRRVFAYRLAISSRVGTGTFHAMVNDGEAGLSMLGGTPREDKQTTSMTVEVATLDNFVDRLGIGSIDVLKIDTEGGDLYALLGAEELIRRHHPAIIVEYSDLNTAQYGYAPDSIENFLRDHGYTWTHDGEVLIARWAR